MNKTLLNQAAIYHHMGWSMIPVPYGRKAPAICWKQYQNKRPSKSLLVKWFNSNKPRNVAVVLGEVSGGLACRDFDTMRGYKEWASQYPDLAKLLPTAQTGRGIHVYFEGCVESSTSIEDANGEHAGELRGSRCCCVLPPSVHPNGLAYKWIIQPTKKNLLYLEPEQAGFITAIGSSYDTERTDGNRGELKGRKRRKQIKKNRKIRESLVKTLPAGFATRHRKIFTFARELKSMPEYGDADPRAFRSIVRDWHKVALPNIRTKEFEETWADFLMAWSDIKYKIGEGPMMQIFKRAAESKPPKIAVRMYPDNKRIQLLAALCKELQLEAGKEPFFLSARTAGKLFNVATMTAWRWLYVLIQDEILKVFWKGRRTKAGSKATRYRYVRSLKD